MLRTARHNRLVYLYTAPAIIIMGLVVVYPFLYNMVISLSNMNLSHFRDWQVKGLGNFASVLTDPLFWYYLFKTVLWTVLNLVFHVGIGVFLALILNKDLQGRTVYRTLLILPWAVPQYITALTWRGMFNSEYGAVNLILENLFGFQVSWLSTEWGAFAACPIPETRMISWGFNSISANACFTALRMGKLPQPGHQVLWKLFSKSSIFTVICPPSPF